MEYTIKSQCKKIRKIRSPEHVLDRVCAIHLCVSIPQALHCGAQTTRGPGTQWRLGQSGIWWMRSPLLCGHTVICVWGFTILCLSGLTLCSEPMLTITSKPMCSLLQRPCLSCTRQSTSSNLKCCGLMVMEMRPTITGTAQGSSPGFITRGKATLTEVS